ncbi:DUF3104 domain-containing protein [Prochlorococcus sp. MIT 1341]|uniref:DUF3104 domain-containing protein n=1 Tax=Prochlorococcus sp. MIT 1341 TaxID=3096221 RepID=UPI002A74A6B1|nr:DUF3104 domain-containing protein [Prochlorococcus sp. MIT 1341]
MAFVSSGSTPDFLVVELGDIIVVEEGLPIKEGSQDSWWLGYVIHIVGGARDPSVNSLFQVVNVDTGMIQTINADLVKGILRPKD